MCYHLTISSHLILVLRMVKNVTTTLREWPELKHAHEPLGEWLILTLWGRILSAIFFFFVLYKQQLKGDMTNWKHWHRISESGWAEKSEWSGSGPKATAYLACNFIDIINVNSFHFVNIIDNIQRCMLENNNDSASSLKKLTNKINISDFALI